MALIDPLHAAMPAERDAPPASAAPTIQFGLSESRIAAFEQCPKKLWLMTHRPALEGSDSSAAARLAEGQKVGEEARAQSVGGFLVHADPNTPSAVETTRTLLETGHASPIFKAAFEHDGVFVKVDVLEPHHGGWRIVGVKAGCEVKPEHRRDIATELWVAQEAGLKVTGATVRHINRDFQSTCAGDREGVFTDVAVYDELVDVVAERSAVVAAARAMLANTEPTVSPGSHCNKPYSCVFASYCKAEAPQWPVSLLGRGAAKYAPLESDLTALDPNTMTSETHRRIWCATVTGEPHRDPAGAATAMAGWSYPRVWLDFETVQHALPAWPGCKPYRQVPFQFVADIEQADGSVTQIDFLHLEPDDPRRRCAEALAQLPSEGAVVAYNASFERARIEELASDFADLASPLASLAARVVDLLPVTRANWYHRDQRGSWSIKAVLPTIASELNYNELMVQHGGEAVDAYREAIAPETSEERRNALAEGLRAYCGQDVFAMRLIADALIKPFD